MLLKMRAKAAREARGDAGAASVPAPAAVPAPASAAKPAPAPAPAEPERFLSVFVRGLPNDADEAAVAGAFERFGAVKGGAKGVTLRPQKSGTERYAFVEFEDADGATAAMANPPEFAGKTLGVEGKREKPAGGRGGGGRGGGGGANGREGGGAREGGGGGRGRGGGDRREGSGGRGRRDGARRTPAGADTAAGKTDGGRARGDARSSKAAAK